MSIIFSENERTEIENEIRKKEKKLKELELIAELQELRNRKACMDAVSTRIVYII